MSGALKEESDSAPRSSARAQTKVDQLGIQAHSVAYNHLTLAKARSLENGCAVWFGSLILGVVYTDSIWRLRFTHLGSELPKELQNHAQNAEQELNFGVRFCCLLLEVFCSQRLWNWFRIVAVKAQESNHVSTWCLSTSFYPSQWDLTGVQSRKRLQTIMKEGFSFLWLFFAHAS